VRYNTQNKRKHLQTLYLIRDLDPEYMKHSYNTIIKDQAKESHIWWLMPIIPALRRPRGKRS
jgi:hypothetical protein